MIGAFREFLARRGVRLNRLPRTLATRPDRQLTLELRHLVAVHAANNPHRPLFRVQIGAHDGKSGDCVQELVRLYGMRGLLVEPQPNIFLELGRTYASYPGIRLRNVAIAERAEKRTLYCIDAAVDLPEWASQLASFHRTSLLRHRHVIPGIERRIVERTVDCVTFESLLEGAPPVVDVLMVDTEGHDAEIVRLFHETGRTAAVLCFEHMYLDRREIEACYDSLLRLGYRLTACGPDTLGVGPDSGTAVESS